MSPWTIEAEICSIADLPDGSVVEAMVKLGLVPYGEPAPRIAVQLDWHAAGAETYQFHFSIDTRDELQSRYLLKSCVALGSLQGVSRLLDEWLARRSLISAHGVDTPHLYGHKSGTILEEWIPISIDDAIRDASDLTRRSILNRLGFLAGTLTKLGFPTLALTDLRSRGADVVIVDFGEDLGPAGKTLRDHAVILEQVLDVVAGVHELTSNDLALVARGFEAGNSD